MPSGPRRWPTSPAETPVLPAWAGVPALHIPPVPQVIQITVGNVTIAAAAALPYDVMVRALVRAADGNRYIDGIVETYPDDRVLAEGTPPGYAPWSLPLLKADHPVLMPALDALVAYGTTVGFWAAVRAHEVADQAAATLAETTQEYMRGCDCACRVITSPPPGEKIPAHLPSCPRMPAKLESLRASAVAVVPYLFGNGSPQRRAALILAATFEGTPDELLAIVAGLTHNPAAAVPTAGKQPPPLPAVGEYNQ